MSHRVGKPSYGRDSESTGNGPALIQAALPRDDGRGFETTQLAVLIQNNEHFSPRDLSSDIVTLFDKMTARRDQLPTGVEDTGLLLAIYAGIRVIPRIKVLLKHKSDRPQVPQKVARTTSSGRGGVWNALW